MAEGDRMDHKVGLMVDDDGGVQTIDSNGDLEDFPFPEAPDIPPGETEIDYVERTTALDITATSLSSAQVFIAGNSRAYDGATRIRIEAYIPAVDIHATSGGTWGGYIVVVLTIDGTPTTYLTEFEALCDDSKGDGVLNYIGIRYLTPSAGNHTYSISAYRGGANTSAKLYGGTGALAAYVPAYLRISTA